MTSEGFSDGLLADIPAVDGFPVLGPCVLYAKLGQGGMGAVYRGRHTNLDIDVAVKCLKKSLAMEDEGFVQRFQREARLAATLNDPNLIRVFDVDEKHGLHYLVMEFVAGESLRERVKRKGRLAVEEATIIIRGAAQGLGVAHTRGIVHRDIKPDNIMVSTDGEVKLADLGLAKAMVSTEGMTATNTVLGTPQYMPPEQWENTSTVEPPGDVWALGATLWFLIGGQDPIKGDSITEILRRVCLEPFPKIDEVVPDLDPNLVRIIEKATAKNPEDRFADAQELQGVLHDWIVRAGSDVTLVDAEAGAETELNSLVSPPPKETMTRVQALASGATAVSPPNPSPALETPTVPSVPTPKSIPPRGGQSSKPIIFALAGVVALLVLVILGFVLFGQKDEGDPTDPGKSQAENDVISKENDPKKTEPKIAPKPHQEKPIKVEPAKDDPKVIKGQPVKDEPEVIKDKPIRKEPVPQPKLQGIEGTWSLDKDGLLSAMVVQALRQEGVPNTPANRLEAEALMRPVVNSLRVKVEILPAGHYRAMMSSPGESSTESGRWHLTGTTIIITTEVENGVRLAPATKNKGRFERDRIFIPYEEGNFEFVLIRTQPWSAPAKKRDVKNAVPYLGRWELDLLKTKREMMRFHREQARQLGISFKVREMQFVVDAAVQEFNGILDIRADGRFRLTGKGVGSDALTAEGRWRPEGNKIRMEPATIDGEPVSLDDGETIFGQIVNDRLKLGLDEDSPAFFRRTK